MHEICKYEKCEMCGIVKCTRYACTQNAKCVGSQNAQDMQVLEM